MKQYKEVDRAKVVYFKDGTHIIVDDGITWEYENDPNWDRTEYTVIAMLCQLNGKW